VAARKPAPKPAASRRRSSGGTAKRTPKRAPKRAAAARAETEPAARVVKYRGLDLSVPPASEWGSEMYYLVLEWQAGDQSDKLALDILVEMVGQDQLALIRQKQREDGVKFVEMQSATLEVFNAIFGEFGTSVGESEASPAS
jgi:hypothetical protein